MIIVKSKITGKYLKRHSGSYSAFKRRHRWKLNEKVIAEVGARPKGHYDDPKVKEWEAKYWPLMDRLIHEAVFSADPLEARVYANKGGALTSVGIWNLDEDGKVTEVDGRVNHLPDHLELHEIVAGNLCLVDPNDDEDVKAAKKERCK